MNNEEFKKKIIQIEDILKTIPGVHIQDIRNFLNGNISVNKKGGLKLPVSLPAEQLLYNKDSVEDVINGNWKIVPLILFVEKDT